MKPRLDLSYRTAIRRKKPSLPARRLHELGLIKGPVLDYGCGFGTDVKFFKKLGFRSTGFDPFYRPQGWPKNPHKYRTILCTYVFNVVFPEEREDIARGIERNLTQDGTIYVTVRTDVEDGLRQHGTYQELLTLDSPIVEKRGSYVIYSLKGGNETWKWGSKDIAKRKRSKNSTHK